MDRCPKCNQSLIPIQFLPRVESFYCENCDEEIIEKPQPKFNLFKSWFEGTIIYKTLNKKNLVTGIIHFEQQEHLQYFFVYQEGDLTLPIKIIPTQNIIEFILGEEEPQNDQEFDYSTTKVTINKEKSLDFESRLKVGTESLGDIKLNESKELDILN